MMQKRTLTSLLLISFLVAFAFSYAMAANEVTFQTKNTLRCNATGLLDITVTNDVDLSAIELVFTVEKGAAAFTSYSVDWAVGFTALGTREGPFVFPGPDADTIRMAAMKIAPGDLVITAGANPLVATVSFVSGEFCEGTVTLDEGTLDVGLPILITTKFVEAAGNTVIPVDVNAGVVTYVNVDPTMDPIPDATIHFGDLFQYSIIADDDDLPNGCESLEYLKLSGPATLAVNPTSGLIGWATGGEDVCEHEVIVGVRDECDAMVVDTFTICVQNDPPVADSVVMDALVWVTGDEVSGKGFATDLDGGPNALDWDVLSFDGPGTVTPNNDGTFSWPTVAFDPDYVGHFTLCLTVSDGANTCDPCSPNNADTICVEFDVLQALVIIDKLHGETGLGVIQGQFYKVPVFLNANVAIGGYNFLFTYDASALTFIKAYEGALLIGCDWEYFTYRTGPFGTCDGACPTGQVRVTAIAEYNDGPNHPDCFGTVPTEIAGVPYPASDDSVLVELEFLVSNDATLGCQFVPISFYWYQCQDNTMSDVTGEILYMARSIWRYAGGEVDGFPSDDIPDAYIELTGTPVFPGGYGPELWCFDGDPENQDKPKPLEMLDFWNGGIDIICPDEIDDRGDINQNSIPYEIADAVMLTNYFIYGQSAFENLDVEYPIAAATAASDVNGDGLTLTVADLVYLIRVIVGDAAPLPNSPLPKTNPIEAKLVTMNGILRDDMGLDISGAYLELRGDVEPVLLADNMRMVSNSADGITKVLVFAPFDEGSSMESFSGDFLDIGNARVISAELATADGQPVYLNVLPSEYALQQNYPNPFNPTTTIEFALPVASSYKLTIINVTGQVVAEFDGQAEAGIHSIVWEAGNNASGVYFYRLATDFKVETKKMVLLK